MPSVDVAFPLRADVVVPRDHGYALYGALSRAHGALHAADWLGVHPLPGTPGTPKDGAELTVEKGRELRLRVPETRIADLLPLTGRTLDLTGRALSLGVPRVYRLSTAATVDARIVYIKLTTPPTKHSAELERTTLDNEGLANRYAAEIRRQLDALSVAGVFELRGRRSIIVSGRRLVGFSVRVGELDADESLRVQEEGLGGKRAMGCGLFRPTRRRIDG